MIFCDYFYPAEAGKSQKLRRAPFLTPEKLLLQRVHFLKCILFVYMLALNSTRRGDLKPPSTFKINVCLLLWEWRRATWQAPGLGRESFWWVTLSLVRVRAPQDKAMECWRYRAGESVKSANTEASRWPQSQMEHLAATRFLQTFIFAPHDFFSLKQSYIIAPFCCS